MEKLHTVCFYLYISKVWSAATKLHQYLHKKKLQELLLLGLSLVSNVRNIVLVL